MGRSALRWLLIVLLGTAGKAVWSAEQAAPLTLAPLHYEQGFEAGPNPFRYWVTNPSKYTINYNDITDEKAASGRKCYKLDITYQEPCYSYWSIPVRVPIEGKLSFRGKILLASGDGVRTGLGVNVIYPQSYLSGCGTFTTCGESKDWQTVTADISALVDSWGGGWPRLVRGLAPEHVGRYVDILGLFLYVSKPTHAVVYVDDLEINGQAPEAQAYEAEVARRWEVYQTRVQNPAVTDFSTRLAAIEKSLGEQTGLDGKVRAGVTEKTGTVRQTLDEVRKKGWMTPGEYSTMDKALTEAADGLKASQINDLFR